MVLLSRLTKMNQEYIKKIREACISANPEIVERDFHPGIYYGKQPDFPFRCVFTEEAIKMGYKLREGDVVGETRNKELYRVRWVGIKSVYTYWKKYIQPSVKSEPPIRLADILLAIGMNKIELEKAVAPERLWMRIKTADGNIKLQWRHFWNLKETLENQSEEYINFLYQLLKEE